MKLLAIDTSGPVCGVAIQTEQGTRYESAVTNKLTHSVNLLPMIDEAFQATNLTIADMDRIAVTVGPGSFTGVRIGVSTVKGLAHGANKPCVAVDALEAMAAGVTAYDGIICPIQDARAGQVYGAAFKATGTRPERLLPDAPLKLEDYLAAIAPLGERFYFLGDGMPVHREKIAAFLGEKAIFANPHQAYLRPGAVAWLASLTAETTDYKGLAPLYLRAPSAERNRKLVEAAHAD